MEPLSSADISAAGDSFTADDVFAWLVMDNDDENTNEHLLNMKHDDTVMQCENTEGRVRFIDDPYESLLVFQSSSSYVTINGNEETCGSSFSDSFTSVMASVDTNSLRRTMAEEERGAWEARAEEARDDYMVLFDCCEWDDIEVLATFLREEEEGDGVFH